LKFDRQFQTPATAAPHLVTRDVTGHMQSLFDGVVAEPLPDRLTVLLQQLDQTLQAARRG
jgi:hypothetical protein